VYTDKMSILPYSSIRSHNDRNTVIRSDIENDREQGRHTVYPRCRDAPIVKFKRYNRNSHVNVLQSVRPGRTLRRRQNSLVKGKTRTPLVMERSGMARVVESFHSFTCTPTNAMNHTCLYLPDTRQTDRQTTRTITTAGPHTVEGPLTTNANPKP